MDRPLDVDGVPERDGRCDESEAACAVALLLEAAISDFSEAAKEYGSSERVARLAFVEASVNAAAQFHTLQPGKDKQCPFDTAQLAQSDSETVLTGVAAQLAKHERGRHGALLDGGGEAKNLVPVSADRFQVDGSTDHGRERLVLETPYPKKVLHLPQVLSQQEVARLIDAALTPFHRILLMTLYATGGRRAEVAQLKDQRRRQPTYGHSHSRWQGAQGPRRHAQPGAAGCAARTLARTEP